MKIYNLLVGRGHWTKNAFARVTSKPVPEVDGPRDGLSCDSYAKTACCWCLMGAVNKVYGCGPDASQVILKLASSIQELFPDRFYAEGCAMDRVIIFNDDARTTKGDVLAVAQHAEV